MVANVTSVLAAYRAASGQAAAPGLAPRDEVPSFAAILEEAGREAVETMKKSERMSAQAVVGQADLTDVVNAVTNAEVTLQTVTTVRDRVITAYQEILRMPI